MIQLEALPQDLHVLIVEDSEEDADLLVRALRRGDWADVLYERVDTRAGMVAALSMPGWDLIVADYSLPEFSGQDALRLALEEASDVPFIIVSGAVSEETAVLSMKAGADDYLSKTNLVRLVPVVERELHKATVRREARLVEGQLRAREVHLVDALRHARVGTWHLDIDSGMAMWSEEACRILGVSADQTSSLFEGMLGGLVAQDRTLLLELLEDPDTKEFVQDLQMLPTEVAGRFLRLRGDIVRDALSKPIEAAGTIQDISQRKGTEAAIERAHLQMEAQNKRLVMLTEQAHMFVDDVSHEFRTPLAVIKEFGSIIADGLAGPTTEEQGQYLGIIDNAVLDLNQMVEDFLDSSKLRAGRLRVDRRPHRIEWIFARMGSGLEKKAAARSIEIRQTIEADLPQVFADEEKVRRVITNLITNAVKFSPEGSFIDLWARSARGGGVEIGVTDRGRGMAEEDLRWLFERFHQVPQSHPAGGKGIGLGLHIARQLVWLNLGAMNVETELGQGSTFSFTLPAHEPAMILDWFLGQALERADVSPHVALLMVSSADPEEAAEDLRTFLADTTRPSDVIVALPAGSGNGSLIVGPSEDPEGWAARLCRARARAIVFPGEVELRPLRVEILGTFCCRAGAAAARACALGRLVEEPAHV